MEHTKSLPSSHAGKRLQSLWLRCATLALMLHIAVLLAPLANKEDDQGSQQPTTLEVRIAIQQPKLTSPDLADQPINLEQLEEIVKSKILKPTNLSSETNVITENAPTKEQKERALSIPQVSLSKMQTWVSNDEYNRAATRSKIIDISKPRKGSYVEKLFDTNRLDIRDSVNEEIMRFGDSSISIVKIKGKQYCAPNGDWYRKYQCGDIDYTNEFLNADGLIKNSDRENWVVN